MTQNRGRVMCDSGHADHLLATVHASSILRIPDPAARDDAFAGFVADLRLVAGGLREIATMKSS